MAVGLPVTLVDQAGNPLGGTSQTGALPTVANVQRSAEILHRVAIATADTLANPGVPTATAITESGSTLANVAYHFAVAAGDTWGPTLATVDGGAVTPTASQSLRIAVAQITGAEYYDIFLSTAAAPLWVCRLTEAQRATGDRICSTVGVLTARAGSTVAGTIDIGIVGTGVASTAAPFNVNTALTPAAITPFSAVGYQNAIMLFKIVQSNVLVAPSFNFRLMVQSVTSPGDWYQLTSAPQQTPLSSNNSFSLEFGIAAAVNGVAAAVVVLSNFVSIATIDVTIVLD